MGVAINDLNWDRMSLKILVALNNGYVHEIKAPSKDECDNSSTYLKTPVQKKFMIRMMEF